MAKWLPEVHEAECQLDCVWFHVTLRSEVTGDCVGLEVHWRWIGIGATAKTVPGTSHTPAGGRIAVLRHDLGHLGVRMIDPAASAG